VKKLIVLGGGAVVAASASMALFGAGVAAAAPDVVGQTYADASAAIDEEGGTVVVASTVGGRLPQDECIVTNAWDAPFVRDLDFAGEFGHADSEVMLALNCNGDHATATNAGPSLGSPEGREAKAAADEAAAAEEQQLAEVSTPNE
jgi:hypothetical protein